jgi:hypothetical protein
MLVLIDRCCVGSQITEDEMNRKYREKREVLTEFLWRKLSERDSIEDLGR